MLRVFTRATVVCLLLALAGPVEAAPGLFPPGAFCSGDSLTVPDGETRTGDTYFFAQNVTISGIYDGDLIGGHGASIINGVVTGDVASFGQSLDIRGEVRDSVRFFGQSLNVTGTIDGDLLAFAAQVNVHPDARITGRVHLLAGSAFIDGTVGQDVTFKGGHISLGGPVAGNVKLTADRVRVAATARVAGDLAYTSRKEIELPEGTVTGEVTFSEKVAKDEDDEPRPFFSWKKLLRWSWWTGAAWLVGLVAIGLLRSATGPLVEPIGRESVLALLIGLGTFLVVPAAALLAIALVIPLPLGVIALMLFLIGVYVAKLPVAIWLGRWVLGRLGMAAPSPIAALAVGVLLLYASFELPFHVGTLAYLVTVWLGLGALVIGLRDRLRGSVAAG